MILSEKKAVGFLRPWWEVVYLHCLGLQIAICRVKNKRKWKGEDDG